MGIAANLAALKGEIPRGVTLVAVSKFKPLEAVLEAYGAGQRVFGENRPQEMAAKAAAAPPDIEWHFIGHLQTNKVKMVVPCASMIESVDSLRLLDAIEGCAASFGKVVDCLIEVHIASEESKQGFSADEVIELAGRFGDYPHVRFRGLMGMASFSPDMALVRSEFRSLRQLFEKVRALLPSADADGPVSDIPVDASRFDTLSMGMSGDWQIAVEEGATHIRLGTAIFGSR